MLLHIFYASNCQILLVWNKECSLAFSNCLWTGFRQHFERLANLKLNYSIICSQFLCDNCSLLLEAREGGLVQSWFSSPLWFSSPPKFYQKPNELFTSEKSIACNLQKRIFLSYCNLTPALKVSLCTGENIF